jgi:aminopeptidase N
MGILASNEFEEPWLDEGVNTYWEGRIIDHYYGSKSGMIDHKLLKISDKSVSRMSYVNADARQAATNAENSWSYPFGTYGMMSYNKAGVILHTLEGVIGEDLMNNIFREYYRKWAFRHPSARDFINTANSVMAGSPDQMYGPDLNWFFNQTIYGTGICDYRVLNFSNRKSRLSDSTFSSSVDVLREGEITLPVEILVHFNDSTEILERWDGLSRTKQFTYTGNEKIEWVKIDPDYKIKLDVNFINNSMTDDPDSVPVRRIRNKLVLFIQFFLSLIFL